MGPVKSDPKKQLIPLTVIPLSGAHYTTVEAAQPYLT